jgi:hypothetical protein
MRMSTSGAAMVSGAGFPSFQSDEIVGLGPFSIVLKPGPVIEPVRLSVQVFTGRTTGSPVHCLVF